MILFAVLTAVALIASPAFAEVQNVKVSGDVNSAGVYRSEYDLRPADATANATEGQNLNSLYTQARVAIDADLTDNVSATVRLLAEYDWDTENNTGLSSTTADDGANQTNTADADDISIDVASVTLKEVFYAPLSVTVGRQELRYGNAFVIGGDPDTNGTSADASITAGDLSLRKSFDGVKAVLDYDPLVVDVLYAKIDESNPGMATPTADENDDEDLYGVNASYDVGNYDAEIEAYWLMNRDNDETNSTGDTIHTIGVRTSLVPIDNLNLSGEIAFQSGDFEATAATTRDQDAMAFQVAGDYTFADFSIPWTPIEIGSPVLKLGWTHYDGEETTVSGADASDQNAWIPLYEDQSHGVVANYILSGLNGGQNSNADILNIGASIVPIEDLTLSVDYYQFWLDEKLVLGDNNQPDTQGNEVLDWINLDNSEYWLDADDDLGYEIDVTLNYDYSEDVKMGLCAGLFNPGEAFDGSSGDDNNTQTALEVVATLDVAF